MLDRYIWGSVERISPEAPVPVVDVSKEEERLGGAANVALNIHSLGGSVVLAGVVGRDPAGEELILQASELGFHTKSVLRSRRRRTTQKIRILGLTHRQLQFRRLCAN